ncbi:hypothetical protein ACFYM2_11595 [Streptomyces sp. NPDC006711]|uniref:hypothetical protein n=1 Tax=Streptomyces sp. NPDC006711 TaxID=3364762 RepID=UPI003686C858
MDTAALVTWVITALGGFYMLGTWLTRGGARGGTSRLPVPVVFGHFALAAIGLVVWIVYLVTDKDALAWTAFILLVPVALLGSSCSPAGSPSTAPAPPPPRAPARTPPPSGTSPSPWSSPTACSPW